MWRVLVGIWLVWRQYPQLRLCQLLVDIADHSDRPNGIFYTSDNEVVPQLLSFTKDRVGIPFIVVCWERLRRCFKH